MERGDQQDCNEVACLERLSEELEHPSRSRRQGARAALRYLNRLVNLRTAAGDVSREDAWAQVVATNEPLLEAAEAPVELVAPRSVEQIVSDIERDVAKRGPFRAPQLLN